LKAVREKKQITYKGKPNGNLKSKKGM
jgi:hypothetical protein